MEESEPNESLLQIPNPPATALPKEPSFSRWCVDEQHPIEPSSATGEKEESEDFDLPLLRSSSEPESPRSNEFRQRSGIGKGYAALDIGIGLHTSESMDKLDSLGNSSSWFSAEIVLRTLFFILVWYTFSTLLTLYNKTLLGDHLGKFPLPLMMNTVHFGMQAVLSNAIVCFQSRCCESRRGPTMTWRDYFMRVVPTALGTALDINLSNVSLVFISVTFATMCKSASPIFLLVFAFVFRLESPSIKLLGIILVISVGILLTGLRNPITLMSYVTPVMAVTTAIGSLVLDPWHNLSKNKYFDSSTHIIQSCLLMLLGGALAFFMVLTEYILVSATSAITVTVAGTVKEAVTILVAVLYFHDQFTLLKGAGLFTIMVGVSLFNWYKYQKLNKGHQCGNGETNSTFNGAAKYVILDEDILDTDT